MLSRFTSNQWAIVSENGNVCYDVQNTRREAIASFMRRVNADHNRSHLKWNSKELKYAKAIKVRVSARVA